MGQDTVGMLWKKDREEQQLFTHGLISRMTKSLFVMTGWLADTTKTTLSLALKPAFWKSPQYGEVMATLTL